MGNTESEPMGSGADEVDERAFYTDLRADGARIVPVVGSGLTVKAGAPSFPALVGHLATEAAKAGGPNGLDVSDWWGTVDQLAESLGEGWVQNATADLFANAPTAPTPALRALSKVRSGLVVTTNYDLAIELSAEAAGMPVETLTLNEFDAALAEPDGTLRVLHLHGVCTDPASIVLTGTSYASMLADARVELMLRDLGIRFRFVFLGHRLDEREKHIRRDLGWTLEAASSVPRQPHLLITNQMAVADPKALAFKDELEANAGVRVVQFDDPDREYMASVRAAHVLAGMPGVERAKQAPLISEDEFDPHYLVLDVAPVEEVEEAGDAGSYRAMYWQSPDYKSDGLDTSVGRLILEAEGGAGKSQELLQIAKRSANPALHQHLSRFNIRPPWADAGQRFVAGMIDARASRPGVDRLTHDALNQEAYVFVLDGLDEVPAADREAVLRLVAAVAHAYPQHRYVIGSRPLSILKSQDSFERWQPITDLRWVNEYALNRGVAPEELAAALPDTGDVADLIQIPIYAEAAVSRVYAGKPLPNTAIELICDLADERLKNDPRIEASAYQLRTWLDRIALAMMLAGVTELSLEQLVATNLHGDLDLISPDEQVMGELVARAILRDVNGMFRFPANVMRESRAARALLGAAADGRALLAGRVLVDLEVPDRNGDPVRGVHPAWVALLELLLPAADTSWHEAVAEFDPVLVARATASISSPEIRMQAVETIWATYVDRRVWLERSVTGGPGDCDAMMRLLTAGPSDEVRQMLLDALDSPERTVRGNAVELLPFVLPLNELWGALTERVGDPDDVVRRHVAAAGFWILREHPDLPDDDPKRVAFVEAMNDQVQVDADRAARETLVGSAIDLATEDRAIEIALGSPIQVRERAVMHLAQRLSRSALLALLAEREPFDSDLFEELQDGRRFGAREAWEPQQVAALVDIILKHADSSYWHHKAIDVLADDRPAALAALSCHPPDEQGDDVLDRRLIVRMGGEELNRSVVLLRARPADLLAEIGIGPGARTLNEEAVRAALEGVDQMLERVRSQPSNDEDQETPPSRARTIVESYGDIAASKTNEELREVFKNDGVAGAFNSDLRSVSMKVTHDLAEAAGRDLPLSDSECLQLFKFLLDWADRDLEPWLERNWTARVSEAVEPSLAGMSPLQVSRLVDLVPQPWTEDMGRLVLAAVAGGDQRTGACASAALKVVENLGESFFRKSVATLDGVAGKTWVDMVLVRLGDAAAEARMIQRLADEPRQVSRHPRAFDEEWVSSVRCPESADLIADLVRRAYAEGVEQIDLEPLSRALDRTGGVRALSIWEELGNQPGNPTGPFLFYQRRLAQDALIAAKAGMRDVTDPELNELVRQTVTGAHE